MKSKHTPVMLDEVITALGVTKGKRYIDATAGQLGHLNKIAELGGEVLGIEYDEAQHTKQNDAMQKQGIRLVFGNFSDIEIIAQKHGFTGIDGVLFDLGISYGQLNESNKGLSYKKEEERLDMKLSESPEEDAQHFLNRATAQEIYEVFARFSEEPQSLKIANEIVYAREKYKLETVKDLKIAITKALGREDHTAYSRIFQALRMFVNNELENLKKGFEGSLKLLKSGGVMVIITFNSGEDRAVKQLIAKNKSVIASDRKVKKKMAKQFERSALMRVVVKS